MNVQEAKLPTTPDGADIVHPSPSLKIHLLGPFRIAVDGESVEPGRWQRRKAALAVQLLALQPHYQMQREVLEELLWPELDPESVKNNFYKVLHAARRALEPGLQRGVDSRFLVLENQMVSLNSPDAVWIDVEAFEHSASHAMRCREVAAYEAALHLYAGDLLADAPYEPLFAMRRERIRVTYMRLLTELAARYEADSLTDKAIRLLDQALAVDGTDEEAHRRLMRLYALHGSRHQALRQYHVCCQTLRNEVDAEPEAETVALYKEIVGGRCSAIGAPGDRSATARTPVESAAASARKENVRSPAVARTTPAPDRAATNLPHDVTSFVGRTCESRDIAQLLQDARLVVLTGPGGIGKSRLAVRVAAEAASRFADGVWLVDLDAIGDAAQIGCAVASTLGVEGPRASSSTDALCAALERSNLLLVLDNCEHVGDAAAAFVHAILARCPKIRVLVTSRQSLGAPGEHLYRVGPLAMPAATEHPELEDVEGIESVALFVARARQCCPAFRIDDTNAVWVGRLCRMLEGTPLALEMAATRVGVLTVREIVERLDEPFAFLKARKGAVPRRHQTLRSAIDWSYSLLLPAERVLLRRVAVFADCWTLQAVEGICCEPGIDGGSILGHLSQLVDKSLIVAGVESDAPRYRMLKPIRLYARELLKESGEETALVAAHATWFTELAERGEQEVFGPHANTWMRWFEDEHANLTIALERSRADRTNAGVFVRLTSALATFWRLRGDLSEGCTWLQDALEHATDVAADVRAELLLKAGMFAFLQGFQPDAGEYFETSLALWHGVGDERGVARALEGLGLVAAAYAADDAALALHEQSAAIARRLGDARLLASALSRLGALAEREGDDERAAALFDESLASVRAHNDPYAAADALHGLGRLAARGGDFDRATAHFEQSLDLYRFGGYEASLAEVFASMGEAGLRRGALDAARSWLETSHERAVRMGLDEVRGVALHALGTLASRRGDAEEAERFLCACLGVARAGGWVQVTATALSSFGDLAREAGDFDGALTCFQEALVLLRDTGSSVLKLRLLKELHQIAGEGWYSHFQLGAAARSINTVADALTPTVAELAKVSLTSAASTSWLARQAAETVRYAVGAKISDDLANTNRENLLLALGEANLTVLTTNTAADPGAQSARLDAGSHGLRTSNGAETLLVGDFHHSLQDLVNALLKRGHKVRIASQGRWGVISAQTRRPDLLLVSATPTDMTVYEICRRLRLTPNTREIPVVVLRDRGGEPDGVAALDAVGDDHLGRAFEISEIIASVEQHRNVVRLQREIEQQTRDLAAKNRELEESLRKLKSAGR